MLRSRPLGNVAPPRRRDARVLVAPFVEAFAALHFTAPVGRGAPEVIQDLSRRGLSFFTSNPDLLARAERTCAVTVECPDGLVVTLGVSDCRVQRPRARGPARVSVAFDAPRPASRPLAPMRRLADGFYAPARRRDAQGIVRALLGVEPAAAERRRTQRIRVPLESELVVRLERGGQAVATLPLADASPRGFACFAPSSFDAGVGVLHARLFWRGRELLAREVRETIAEPAIVRGTPATRLRILLDGDAGPSSWDLPLWAGAHEFGALRPSSRTVVPELVQAAMLAKGEVAVGVAKGEAEIETARILSHEAFVSEGDVEASDCPVSTWIDSFDEHSVVWVARAGDVIVGTLRFVREGALGLPHRGYCPEAFWPPAVGRRVEATRLAVSRTYRPDVNARLGVAVLLIVCGVEWSIASGYDALLMGARVEHGRFYEAIGLVPLTPEFRHARYGLPSRLWGLDLRSPSALRRFRRLVR